MLSKRRKKMPPEILLVLVVLAFTFPIAVSAFGFVLLIRLYSALKLFPPISQLERASKVPKNVEDASGVLATSEGFQEWDQETQLQWLHEQLDEKDRKELEEVLGKPGEKEGKINID